MQKKQPNKRRIGAVTGSRQKKKWLKKRTEEDKSKRSKSGKREMVDLALIQVHLLDSNRPQSFQQKSTTL